MTLLLTLLIAGVALLLAEVFLPGMIAGVLGVVCLLGAAVVGFAEFGPKVGSLILMAELFAGTVLTILWMRYFPKTPLGKKYILDPSTAAHAPTEPEKWLGYEGVALTDLRPAGSARLEGEKVDVITNGEHLESGTRVKVVRVDGPSIFVRRL
jgi:membrane-bound serine protease (ClpP class)